MQDSHEPVLGFGGAAVAVHRSRDDGCVCCFAGGIVGGTYGGSGGVVDPERASVSCDGFAVNLRETRVVCDHCPSRC